MRDYDAGQSAPFPEDRETGERLNRRDFLRRLAGASAVAVAAGGLGLALYDAKGPAAGVGGKVLNTLGDFSVPAPAAGKPRLAEVHGTDRRAMFAAGVKSLGGMEAFVSRGDVVLLKVNAAFASPPLLGATTHPDLLAAVATACREAGAARILVTDNPINNPDSCFEVSGLSGAARAGGADIVLPRPALFSPLTLPGGKLLTDWPVLAGAFAGVTKVIALAPVKDHQRAGASMSLKNFYGLLGGRRNIFHQDINGVIAELGRLLRPTLCVLDGTSSMMTNGPTGGSLSDLKATGTMILSADPVAADTVGVTLLSRAPADLPYLRLAAAAGVGTTDVASLFPVTVHTEPAAG
ncbi:protein of unknown function DUF362 [Solidesulfovibrio carbinoliphilus subsp. oakridgensis]|uniref:DUF362 domain-containing protein n=1 Tax=Solidesulfovibrio carbinoliphilus subsp. oakridgensis TaxID=694327 RepID=G7QBD6_9BACT|nr:DUF362 domain-containing protein [Solidesulfovibrio carbinoliphilus]EHJ49359.1 protein of unknown function DUF362 [Solidesulfovibrio carbinoliphilus subsp. oakridgensis]